MVIDTNSFHLDRATLFACAYGENIGLSVSGLAAEGVIADRYPERADELAALYPTDQMEVIRTKETAEVILIIWDHKGYVPTWVRSVLDSEG